jgi:MFS family permease
MLDGFDVMLYALLLASIVADLGISRETAGAIGPQRSWRRGRLVFGMIADRYGRTRP